MHAGADVALRVVEEVGVATALFEAELGNQERAVFLLPAVCGHPRAVHVALKPRTHSFVVAVLTGQSDIGRRIFWIDQRVEIRALDVHKAQLRPLRRSRIQDGLVGPDLSHSETDYSPERLKRRGWCEVRCVAVVVGFKLSGNQS